MTRRGYVAGALAALVLLVVPLALGSLHTRADSRKPTPPADRTSQVSLVAAGSKMTAKAITCESGEVVSLRTQPSCLELSVGGVDYWNTDEPFHAFLTALRSQRASRTPPTLSPATALDCNPGEPWQDYPLSPLGEPVDMVEAVSRGVCQTYLLSDVSSAPEYQEFWYPSPEAQRILDGLRR